MMVQTTSSTNGALRTLLDLGLTVYACINLVRKIFQKLIQLVRQLELHPVAAAQLLNPELLDPLGRAILLQVCPRDVVSVRNNKECWKIDVLALLW